MEWPFIVCFWFGAGLVLVLVWCAALLANMSLQGMPSVYTVNMTGLIRLDSGLGNGAQWVMNGNLSIYDAVTGEVVTVVEGADSLINPNAEIQMAAFNVIDPNEPGLVLQVGQPGAVNPPVDLVSGFVPGPLLPGYVLQVGMIVQRVGSGTINDTNCQAFPQPHESFRFYGIEMATSEGKVPIDMAAYTPQYPYPCKLAVAVENPLERVTFSWNVNPSTEHSDSSLHHQPSVMVL